MDTTSPGEAPRSAVHPARVLNWSGSQIIDVCVVRAPYGHLLILSADGTLHGVDLDASVTTELSRIDLPPFGPGDDNSHFGSRRWRLHASENGEFAAMVVDFGRQGLVVNVTSGEITLRLDGGDHCEETVPFSVAFTRHAGRDVLVHRTAWNQLDVSDGATGRLLTERDIATWQAGEARPLHNLDYFHGRLSVSPAGGRVFDDGWIWHPVAVPRTWSLRTWLETYPWESEDGDTVIELPPRDKWTIPSCWVDENRLALWGLVDWDGDQFAETNHEPGVCIYDVSAPDLATRRIPIAIDGVLNIFSDGRHLFVVSESGTEVRDITSGILLSAHPGFVARLDDRSRNTLVSFVPDQIAELKIIDSTEGA